MAADQNTTVHKRGPGVDFTKLDKALRMCLKCCLPFIESLAIHVPMRQQRAVMTTQRQMLQFFWCKYCTKNFYIFSAYKRHVESHEIIFQKFWLTRGGVLSCKCGYMIQGNGLRTHSGCDHWKNARRTERSKYYAFWHIHPLQITSLFQHKKVVKMDLPKYNHIIKIEERHWNPGHECPHCGRGFRKLKNLEQHKRIHTGDTNYQCKKCLRHFISKSGLDYHTQTKHTTSKPFICELCNRAFVKFSHMERHKRVHLIDKPFKCKICDRGYITNSNLKVHERTHLGVKPFKCHVCDRGFWQKAHMKDHLTQHSNVVKEKLHVCDICQTKFHRKKSLTEHYRTHTGEKPYQCQSCTMAFAASGQLLKHVRKHTGARPYKCRQCERSYASPAGLKRHIMQHHTGVKPYTCSQCNKSFAFPADLEGHVQTHLPGHDKPFKCLICGRGYIAGSRLRNHVKTHSGIRPYKCQEAGCVKAFDSSSKLDRHTSTHTGDRNFQCSKCSKAFTQPGNLKRHVLRHTGVKPYKCCACDYISSEKGNLKRHVKYKHPIYFTENNLNILLDPANGDWNNIKIESACLPQVNGGNLCMDMDRNDCEATDENIRFHFHKDETALDKLKDTCSSLALSLGTNVFSDGDVCNVTGGLNDGQNAIVNDDAAVKDTT